MIKSIRGRSIWILLPFLMKMESDFSIMSKVSKDVIPRAGEIGKRLDIIPYILQKKEGLLSHLSIDNRK